MIGKEIINSFSWSFFVRILSAVLQIATVSILARILDPTIFGTMGILLIIVGFSKIFSEFGLGAALVQKDNIVNTDLQNTLFFSLIISTTLSLITFFFSRNIAVFFNNNELISPLKIISLVFIIDSVSVIQIALAQKKMDFKFISLVQLISYIIGNSLLTIILSLNGFDIWALVIGYIASSVITIVFYFIKYGFFLPRFNKHGIGELFSFSSYFTIGRIANYFANQGDFFIVGKFLGSEALGFYSRAYQIMITPSNLMASSLQQVLFPAFSRIQKDIENLREYFLLTSLIILYPSFLGFSILFFWGNEIIMLLLGPGWEEVTTPLQILAAGIIFKMGYKITTPIMNAVGLVKKRAVLETFYMTSIFVSAYLGSLQGISGVAYGVLFSLIINFIIANYICASLLKISFKKMVINYINPMIILIMFLGLNYSLKIDICMFLLSSAFVFIVTLFLFRKNQFLKEIQIIKRIIK